MKNRKMHPIIWICLLLFVAISFLSCTRTWLEEEVLYAAPSWTSEGNIVFVEEHTVWKYEQRLFMGNHWVHKRETWLCEIDNDGSSKQRIAMIFDSQHRTVMTSATMQNYVLLYVHVGTDDDYTELWVMNRDGSQLQKVAEDKHFPDFSPDEEKIIYQSYEVGSYDIWIMDRDGTNNHEIIEYGYGSSWSLDTTRIAFFSSSFLKISDTSGTVLDSFHMNLIENGPPDWSPIDTNAVSFANGYKAMIFYLETEQLDTLANVPVSPAHRNIFPEFYVRWSPLGNQFLISDTLGWYITNRDGSGKWYLTP